MMSHDLLLQIPGLGFSVKVVIAWTTLALSFVNLILACYIILTSGVGKNGSTVAVRELCSLLALHLSYIQMCKYLNILVPGYSRFFSTTVRDNLGEAWG